MTSYGTDLELSTDNNYSLDSDDDFRSGCRNVSHHYRQQSFSGLHSPGRSDYTLTCYITHGFKLFTVIVLLFSKVFACLCSCLREKRGRLIEERGAFANDLLRLVLTFLTYIYTVIASTWMSNFLLKSFM